MKFSPSFSFLSSFSSFFALIFFYFLLYSPSYDGSVRNNVRLDLYLDKETCDLTFVWTKWLVTWLDLTSDQMTCDLIKLGLARKWLVTWLGLARKWLVTWLGLAKNDLLPSLSIGYQPENIKYTDFILNFVSFSPSPLRMEPDDFLLVSTPMDKFTAMLGGGGGNTMPPTAPGVTPAPTSHTIGHTGRGGGVVSVLYYHPHALLLLTAPYYHSHAPALRPYYQSSQKVPVWITRARITHSWLMDLSWQVCCASQCWVSWKNIDDRVFLSSFYHGIGYILGLQKFRIEE